MKILSRLIEKHRDHDLCENHLTHCPKRQVESKLGRPLRSAYERHISVWNERKRVYKARWLKKLRYLGGWQQRLVASMKALALLKIADILQDKCPPRPRGTLAQVGTKV